MVLYFWWGCGGNFKLITFFKTLRSTENKQRHDFIRWARKLECSTTRTWTIFPGGHVAKAALLAARHRVNMSLKSVLVLVVIMLFSQKQTLTYGKCLRRDSEVSRHLISSNESWDNYFRISKAVYPSVSSPASMIKVWVHFVDSSGFPVSQSTYTWSKSCLFVSTKFIGLRNMELFSLGAIWPSRAQTELHIKMPRLCADVDEQATMTYFLSTVSTNTFTYAVVSLGYVAVPSAQLIRPALNTSTPPRWPVAKSPSQGIPWSSALVGFQP